MRIATAAIAVAALCAPGLAAARYVDTRVSDAVSGVNGCFDAMGPTDLDAAVMKEAGWTRTAVKGGEQGFQEATWSLKGRPTTMIVIREDGAKPLCGVTLDDAAPNEFDALEATLRARHGFSDEMLRQDGMHIWVLGPKVITMKQAAEDGASLIRVIVSRRDE